MKKEANKGNINVEAITNFLFIGEEDNKLHKSDLVIVLGNDCVEATMAHVFRLYRDGVITDSTKIILSGATGILDAEKDLECNRMYDMAVNVFNMNSTMFMKEPDAKNTYENFVNSKAIVEQLGGFNVFKKILCIGNAFLLRRASMYATKLGYPLEKLQYSGVVDTEGRSIAPDTWWKNPDSEMRVMEEIERIGKYYRLGYLSIN